jgi:hypothetical protein
MYFTILSKHKNTSTVEEKQSLLQQYNLFLCDNIVHFGTKFAFANLFRKYSKTHFYTSLSQKHFKTFFLFFSAENETKHEPYFFEFLAILIRVTFLTASFDEKKSFRCKCHLHCNSFRLD